VRLATFNVENMFERPAAMNLPQWSDGREVLEDFAKLNDLIARANYTKSVKDQLLAIMGSYPGLLTQGTSKFIRLREVRGKLVGKVAGQNQVKVDRRNEWVGWFELVPDRVDEEAVINTGRIINLVNADILCVVEADSRVALTRFNGLVLEQAGGASSDHVMLIDGNDERGIDVGILTRQGFSIDGIVSHVDDADAEGVIFSRDCAEYGVDLPGGGHLLVLTNHFKSKGYGSQVSSNAKRERQAARVRQIYDARRAAGVNLIAVVGDLNDTPDSVPLAPLLKGGSDLVDVMDHPAFVGDGRAGTHGNGTPSSKLDYILMSPALAGRVNVGGIERRGVWGGQNGTLFPHIPEITKEIEAASDHAALWVDFA